jgi:hypothetical protein
VEDHAMAQQRPLAALDQVADDVFDLDRVFFGGPAPTAHEPAEMGVHGDAGMSKALPRITLAVFSRCPAARRDPSGPAPP